MREELVFQPDDRIAIIAPHPDDECLGASAALLKAPDRTDVFVMTDGSHGFPGRPIEEEAAVRRAQFEAEMEYAGPRSWKWLGIEDTKLAEHQDAADQIDFTVYTKIFLPWITTSFGHLILTGRPLRSESPCAAERPITSVSMDARSAGISGLRRTDI